MDNCKSKHRPYLSIMFECCSVYQRVYRKQNEAAYEGRCPRCLRTIRFRVSPEGTPSRAFAVR